MSFFWTNNVRTPVTSANPLPVTAPTPLSVLPPKAATASLTNVASSATSVAVLAANTNRKGLIVENDSTAILYLKFGATASTTSFTIKMVANTRWEMQDPIYTGQIDGIWATANGAARVTELT